MYFHSLRILIYSVSTDCWDQFCGNWAPWKLTGSLTLSTAETGAFPMGPVRRQRRPVGLSRDEDAGWGTWWSHSTDKLGQKKLPRATHHSHNGNLTHLHRESNPQRRHIRVLSAARGSALRKRLSGGGAREWAPPDGVSTHTGTEAGRHAR